jgi:hypothetical protein
VLIIRAENEKTKMNFVTRLLVSDGSIDRNASTEGTVTEINIRRTSANTIAKMNVKRKRVFGFILFPSLKCAGYKSIRVPYDPEPLLLCVDGGQALQHQREFSSRR